jgi:hypothetical protein
VGVLGFQNGFLSLESVETSNVAPGSAMCFCYRTGKEGGDEKVVECSESPKEV